MRSRGGYGSAIGRMTPNNTEVGRLDELDASPAVTRRLGSIQSHRVCGIAVARCRRAHDMTGLMPAPSHRDSPLPHIPHPSERRRTAATVSQSCIGPLQLGLASADATCAFRCDRREWAQVRALAADGVSRREIAQRLGINRRTIARLWGCEEPPRYRRPPRNSKLEPFPPVLRRLLEDWPQIKAPRATELLRDEYGYDRAVDLVKRRLRELRPRQVRPAQRTGYRPGQVLQLDWAEMPTRPTVAGKRAACIRACYLAAVLGRADGVLLARSDAGVVPGGHVRALEWPGGVPREASTTTCARSSRAARATRSSGIAASCICAATTASTRTRARRRRRARKERSRPPCVISRAASGRRAASRR
jgi:hypothetical protein